MGVGWPVPLARNMDLSLEERTITSLEEQMRWIAPTILATGKEQLRENNIDRSTE
jgi:hypothetical protein